ncbi:hypothetical protein MN608_10836 [Microdochium nivale]|nr:hypothetical protein MN608_10836 [Microdochium nivale]
MSTDTATEKAPTPAKCVFTAFSEYQDQSVLDLSGGIPFLVHMRIKQASSLARTTATADQHQLTFLLTGSLFDLPLAVRKGTIKLVDITDCKAPITVDTGGGDVLEASYDLSEPWVVVQDPKMMPGETQKNETLPNDQEASAVTFPASSLITLPATRDGTGGKMHAAITSNMTDILRPFVSSGRKYKLVFPADPGDMNVHWWSWAYREDVLHDISHNHDAGSGNILTELLTLTLADLPKPSLASRSSKLKFSQLRTGAIYFRVVDRLPIPPVLQVKLSLRHNPFFALRDGEEHDEGCDEKYYTLCATTTYPLHPASSSPTSTPSPGPITVQLWGPQAHLTRPRQPTASDTGNIKLKPVIPDISAPIFGTLPSLHNLHIIDILTGEDLVHHPHKTHPQDTPLRPDIQFLTLQPGESVTRDVALLPYPDRSRRRPPRPEEPGYYAFRVRDMQAGRRYRIRLRGGREEERKYGGGKGFWWREGTRDEFFAGVWDGLEEEAEGSRKRTAAARRRVFRDLQLPLYTESDDEIIVECPASAGWRDEDGE